MLFLLKLNAAMLGELILSARNVCAWINLTNQGQICNGNSVSKGEHKSRGSGLRKRCAPQKLVTLLHPQDFAYVAFHWKNLPDTLQQN